MVEEKKQEKTEPTKNYLDDFVEKARKNPWMASTIVLAVVAIVFLYFIVQGGGGVSVSSGASKLVDFLNKQTGGGVSLVSSKSLGSLYEVLVSYQGQEIPVYLSKDGKYFIQQAIPITENRVPINNTNTNVPQDIPQTDKPKVELFVMTYCPYGTQAEKGIIPAIKLLGNKADATIRFVHYFMHGDKEESETYTQLCIREQQKEKFLAYLECFLEDGNSSRCLTKTAINQATLKSCLTSQAKNYYAQDSALSNSYGVQGSPTLIINGVEASSGRSSSAFLQTICSAFNTPASECSQKVSSDNPSAGFGYNVASSSSTASCG